LAFALHLIDPHMMIRDSAGNQYCDDVLGKPLDQFQIEPDPLKIIKESLIFKASTHVSKVIFIARLTKVLTWPVG
jgi:hypothetical protein